MIFLVFYADADDDDVVVGFVRLRFCETARPTHSKPPDAEICSRELFLGVIGPYVQRIDSTTYLSQWNKNEHCGKLFQIQTHTHQNATVLSKTC